MVAQKNSKTSKPSTPVVEKTTPVVEKKSPVADKSADVNAAPVAQKAGAKKAPVKKAAPVKEAAVVEEAGVKAAPAVKKTPVKKTDAATPKKVAPKKAAVPKKQAASKKVEKEGEEDVEDEDEGKTRSFKVQLPNETEFSGRFTGLTPYQAANKALSKFFRNSENTNITTDHIIFSIKESTRGSKRSTYTYKGTRVKLEKAITYTIKSADGQERVITKQYKNQLIKVKKGASTEQVVAAVANA